MIHNMLSFNPYFRQIALESVLENPIFNSIRDPIREQGLQKMQTMGKLMIELEIDSVEAFDYEDASKAKYSVD